MSFRQAAKGGALDEEEPLVTTEDQAADPETADQQAPEPQAAQPEPQAVQAEPEAPAESSAQPGDEAQPAAEIAPEDEEQPQGEAAVEDEAQHEAVAEAPAAPKPARTKRPVSYSEVFASATPDEVVQPEDSLPEITLTDLPEALQSACKQAGWDQLMPVQSMAVPYLLAGRDLMIQSRTGSGKTGAFVLPVLDRIDTSRDECQALALVPTARVGHPGGPGGRDPVCGHRGAHRHGLRRHGLRQAARRPQAGRPLRCGHAGPSARPSAAPFLHPRRHQDPRVRRGGSHALHRLLPRYEAGAALPARAQGQHVHDLGHLSAARHASGRRVHGEPAALEPLALQRACGRDPAQLLRSQLHGKGPHPGAHHRDRKPGLGLHLLQHQAERALHHRRAPALRLRCRRALRRPEPEQA